MTNNFISAYALIILSLEEIGKAVLLWRDSLNYNRDLPYPLPWFKDHSKKLDAAFWFHRRMIRLSIEEFLKKIKCEREDSLYVNWDDEIGKWITPRDWFSIRNRTVRYPDSIKTLLNLAKHILDGARRNL